MRARRMRRRRLLAISAATVLLGAGGAYMASNLVQTSNAGVSVLPVPAASLLKAAQHVVETKTLTDTAKTLTDTAKTLTIPSGTSGTSGTTPSGTSGTSG